MRYKKPLPLGEKRHSKAVKTMRSTSQVLVVDESFK